MYDLDNQGWYLPGYVFVFHRPAPKRVEKVMGKYDFDGSDPDDLPFKKGELLTVVSKVIRRLTGSNVCLPGRGAVVDCP